MYKFRLRQRHHLRLWFIVTASVGIHTERTGEKTNKNCHKDGLKGSEGRLILYWTECREYISSLSVRECLRGGEPAVISRAVVQCTPNTICTVGASIQYSQSTNSTSPSRFSQSSATIHSLAHGTWNQPFVLFFSTPLLPRCCHGYYNPCYQRATSITRDIAKPFMINYKFK